MAVLSLISQRPSNPSLPMKFRRKTLSPSTTSGPAVPSLLLRRSCLSTTRNTMTKTTKTTSCTLRSSRCQLTRPLPVATTVRERWLSICRRWRTRSTAPPPLITSPSRLRRRQRLVKAHSLRERSSQRSIS